MKIRTTYPSSFCFLERELLDALDSGEIHIDVFAVDSGTHLASVKITDALRYGTKRWLKDEFGVPYQSHYKVYNF